MAKPRTIILTGATGTIGRAVLAELQARGYRVICLVRAPSDALEDTDQRVVDFGKPSSIETAIGDDDCDAVVSCMASRTGTPKDAEAVDNVAQSNLLMAAQAAGVPRFILLSAICVQKPLLAFQNAKLAFEAKLAASGVDYTIVRPTAFMKSLSGQIDRVRSGKPYLIFGDGTLTRCKPISDRDLAAFMVDQLDNPDDAHRIKPIGGPGPAINPREMGDYLFQHLGKKPKFKSVNPRLLLRIASLLDVVGILLPTLKVKAELARIGHYYATESMLAWNDGDATYSDQETPEFGHDTLFDHYDDLIKNGSSDARGDHKVF